MNVRKWVRVHVWRRGSERTVPLMGSWMESSLTDLQRIHTLHCCLADEGIGQIVFTVIPEWIPLLVLSHHGSYVTIRIFPMADCLSHKCNSLNVSWPFSVSTFRGLKVFGQLMSDFRCQSTICYHLLETVGSDLSIGEQNLRLQNQCKVTCECLCVVVVGLYILFRLTQNV